MLLAPVVMVIGEQIHSHAKRLHAPKLSVIGQLAVLQGEAVVAPGPLAQGRFQAVESHLGRLVAVGVRVNLHTMLEPKGIGLPQRLRGGVPQAVGCPVVIARPAQPGRKSLDGAIRDRLDPAEPKPLGTARTNIESAGDDVGGTAPDQAQEGHQANRVVRLARDLQPTVDLPVARLGGQVGGGGHAGTHCNLAEGPNTELVATEQPPVQADMGHDRVHRLRTLELPGGYAILTQRNARMIHPRAQQPRSKRLPPHL